MASKGPAEQMLTALLSGGEKCAETMSSVLDHVVDLLEHLSAASPRKTRRSLRGVSDRAEDVTESIDAEWCEGVCRCGEDEMRRLSSPLVSALWLSPLICA
eukprot:COSAG02_NODE_36975_length_448_cov_0.739255_1_plen_100_part_01